MTLYTLLIVVLISIYIGLLCASAGHELFTLERFTKFVRVVQLLTLLAFLCLVGVEAYKLGGF